MRGRAALTTGLIALLSLALASPASAVWTHKGKGELKENASLGLAGNLTLSTSAGNIACAVTIGTTLTASSSSGHVNSFAVAKPSECDLTGSLAAICGTNGLTKVEKTGTWALAADENDITLSAIDVHYALAGCLISSFRLKGAATISLDKAGAIGTASFSGTQTLYNAAGEESGTGELKGTLTASPAATYGTKTAASVETVWTDGNEQLAEDGKLTLSGAFSFSGSGGSISCTATIKLLLESSTVEEEEPEGEVESFTVANPSACDLEGGYKTTCGTNAVAKVEQTGTATLSATEADIKVSGLVLDYEFEKCAITSLRVEGSPTLTPSNPESITAATFSAGGLEVFNSKGETLNTASAGGSPTASPGGTFQLASSAPVWKHGSTPISSPQELHVEGELSSTVIGGGGLVSGPCEVTFVGEAENVNGMAHATITGGTIQEECETNVPGCTIAPTLENFPWTATGTEITEAPGLEIATPTFTNHYSAGCPVPISTIETEGIATGLVEESGCLSFEGHLDDLFLEAPLPSLTNDILGGICDTTLTLG